MAPILALTKVKAAEDDALEKEEEEEADSGKLEQQREARHIEAAAMAAAATPTRPRGANQWSEVDALTEGVSHCRLSDTPSPAHFKAFQSSQAYITDAFAAAENIWRLDVVDHRLHVALYTLKLDDEIGNEDARRGREILHNCTQERLAEAFEMEANAPSAEKVVPTSTKVDGAFSEWFNLLTLDTPATPHEEEACFLERVTAQTSVREAISAMAVDKKAQIEEKEKKAVAAAREQKMIAMEAQHREAVWQAYAEAQAAQQAHAKREQHEEEERKAAAAREQQRVALEADQEQKKAIRATLADAKRRRAKRIRRAALAQVNEAREDRRSLSFPCSRHLRSLWRQGKLG